MPTPGREVNVTEDLHVELEESVPEEETESTGNEETETPSESSPEEKPDNVDVQQESEISEEPEAQSVEQKPDPKPVDGETPRERALRLELQKTRAKLRAKRIEEVIPKDGEQPIAAAPNNSDRLAKLKEKYSEEDLASLSEVFTVYAEDMGFVRKDQVQQTTFQQTATDILDEFLEEHKEYMPENDPDNVLWNQFQDEIKLYRRPDNPREYRKIFERVHQNIFGTQSPEKLKKIEAQQAKIKTASHSTSPKSSVKPTVSTSKPLVDTTVAKQFMHGFSEEDLKEIGLD